MLNPNYTPEKIIEYQAYYNIHKQLKATANHFNLCRQTLAPYLKLKSIRTYREISDKSVNRNKNYRRTIKQKAVDYKGGKCELCGYNKTINALEFHHLDPKQKDISISGGTKSFEKIEKELDKCVLLCANCHREIHANLHSDIYSRTDTA